MGGAFHGGHCCDRWLSWCMLPPRSINALLYKHCCFGSFSPVLAHYYSWFFLFLLLYFFSYFCIVFVCAFVQVCQWVTRPCDLEAILTISLCVDKCCGPKTVPNRWWWVLNVVFGVGSVMGVITFFLTFRFGPPWGAPVLSTIINPETFNLQLKKILFLQSETLSPALLWAEPVWPFWPTRIPLKLFPGAKLPRWYCRENPSILTPTSILQHIEKMFYQFKILKKDVLRLHLKTHYRGHWVSPLK